MESKKVFKKGDKVFYPKEAKMEKINGTYVQFYYVRDGVVIYDSNNNDYFTKHGRKIETPSEVFTSYREAETRTKELNNKSLSKIEEFVEFVKEQYPL